MSVLTMSALTALTAVVAVAVVLAAAIGHAARPDAEDLWEAPAESEP